MTLHGIVLRNRRPTTLAGRFGAARAMPDKARGDSPRRRKLAAQAKHTSRSARVPGDSAATVVGVRISHPDRLIYPDLGISKIELARYYERIADWIVPHVAGRPLTLVHCPAGIAAPCNFLKHAKAWGPSALRRVRIQEKTKVGEYLVADSIEAIVSLAQMGIVEIHTWIRPLMISSVRTAWCGILIRVRRCHGRKSSRRRARA
jgi:hypothetical protein